MKAITIKVGDIVKVQLGRHRGKTGTVEMIHIEQTSRGLYELVWVRFPDGDVDSFKPRALQRGVCSSSSQA